MLIYWTSMPVHTSSLGKEVWRKQRTSLPELIFLGWKVFFMSSWARFETRFKPILDSLARNVELVDKEAQAISIVEAKACRSRAIEETAKREQDNLIFQRQAVISWLQTDISLQEDELHTQLDRCHTDTCNWITKNHKLSSWIKRGPGKKILWMKGKPGAGLSTYSLERGTLAYSFVGKTVLCSRLIHFMKQDGQTTVLFYFCNNYRSAEANGLVYILRSFCAQLIQAQPDLVSYFFDEHLAKGLSPSIPNLLRALPLIITSIEAVRIVIDGLDEWDTQNIKKTINELAPLVSASSQGLSHRLLFSSRDVPQISQLLSKKDILSLGDEKSVINIAMQSYIHAGVTEIGAQFQSHVDQSILREVETELVEKADGMHECRTSPDVVYFWKS
jgi:hypothetical protein